MIFLIFIKNIKKINCLAFLIFSDDNSEIWCVMSNYVLGNFLESFFAGKFLFFL